MRACLVICALIGGGLTGSLQAQAPPTSSPLLMLSDIHFDPFHDPGKFAQLQASPATGWADILDAPATPTQAADIAALESTCKVKGVDTPIALLESALHEAHERQPHPLFVTVSGDLMAHKFDCRFQKLAPKALPADYTVFAAKTVAFVALRLRLTFPGTPVYFALGNNDSGCQDYSEDSGSAFLRADAVSFAADVLARPNRDAILRDFSPLGDYNIALPIPQTRLLVLQDIFESRKYSSCAGDARGHGKRTPAAIQIAWLRAQLTAARAAHQRVWVMAHIPPGIDAYSTFAKARNICGGEAPEPFLSTDELASTLAGFGDIIKLALFGHTHMDEMRAYTSAAGATIPGKLVPSISPVNGNNPALTLAVVQLAKATLTDYTVFSGAIPANGWDNATADGIEWAKEYRFGEAYDVPDFSGASVAKLTSGFRADREGSAAASMAYERFYFAGDPHVSGNVKAAAMRLIWPGYVCSITQPEAAAFRSCLCPAAP